MCENSLEEEGGFSLPLIAALLWVCREAEILVTKVTHLVVMREQKQEVGRGQGKERTCSQGLKFLEPPKVMSPAVDHSFTT